ncbi:MAG TPA: methyltransferase [Pyrinomonadaceae bacterium]|nr:methyltransferase [Pyrinomonadaceae bacterium]
MSPLFLTDVPVQMGTDQEFARVALSLKRAAFDEETLLRTLKIKSLSEVGSVPQADLDFGNTSATLELFIKLFLFQRLVSLTEVESSIDADELQAFLALGLLGMDECSAGQAYSRVLLYPLAGFLVASDRHSNPDGSAFNPPPDIVFPAIYGGTLRFLNLVPRRPFEAALDVCAGSGIGAFVLSRHSKHAVCTDITERATSFALFNLRLNGLDNVEAVCGDCYAGVKGRSFDCIVAHPPYVPSLGIETIWRDGGPTGELLVRRLVEGLPQHLRPGGIFCLVTLALDTKEGSFEERARSWLDSSAGEFDIIFAATNERSPETVLKELGERNETLGAEGTRRIGEAFAEAGVEKLPYGALVMHRRVQPGERQPWTCRTTLSEVTDGSDFEAAFALHRQLAQPGALQDLAEVPVHLAPRLQVIITHVVHEGELTSAEHVFETDKPFAARGVVDRWMVPLLARCNGESSPRKIYDQSKMNGELPDGFELDDFTSLIARMLERGFLLLPEPALG